MNLVTDSDPAAPPAVETRRRMHRMIKTIIVASRPASARQTEMPTDPRSLLPLRPVEYLLLLALVEEEQHGYALAKEIAERTDGVVTLEPGNLYRVIKRLSADKLVEASERKSIAPNDDERRRYYKLTSLGQQVAALEGERLRKLLASKPARELARIAGMRA